MKEKRRIIVVFSVFLLAVIVFGVFVYKVSGSSKENNKQPRRQTKIVEIKSRLLDPNPLFGDSKIKEALLEIENNKEVVFNLKIKDFKDYEHGGFFIRREWERIVGTHQVAYSFSMPPITIYLQGGEQREIEVEQLSIVWKNKNCEILGMDNIFKIGENIELRLGIGGDAREYKWGLLGGKSGNGNYVFALEIYNDYEIITPNRKVKFY